MKKGFNKGIILLIIISIISMLGFTGCKFDKNEVKYPITFSNNADGTVVLTDQDNCTLTNVYIGAVSGEYDCTISGTGTWSVSGDKVTIKLNSDWIVYDDSDKEFIKYGYGYDPGDLIGTIKSSKIIYQKKTYKKD